MRRSFFPTLAIRRGDGQSRRAGVVGPSLCGDMVNDSSYTCAMRRWNHKMGRIMKKTSKATTTRRGKRPDRVAPPKSNTSGSSDAASEKPASKKRANTSTRAIKKTKVRTTSGAVAAPRLAKTKARAAPTQKKSEVVLLSGGNPQIAKADGDEPVQLYISAMPEWKSAVRRRLDALIVEAVPGVRKAVRWNSPFYGMEGKGWFMSFHCFTKYVKVAFLFGRALEPMPPGTSKDPNARYLDIYEKDSLDDELFKNWVRQASRGQGWIP